MKRFRRVCNYEFNAVCLAGADELRAELKRLASRPNSVARTKNLELNLSTPDAWELALTELEFDNLQLYKQCCPNGAYSLNQSFDAGSKWMSLRSLHAIVKNVGVLWNQSLPTPRPFMPTELMLGQSFPVHSMADANELFCSFQLDRPAWMPPRNPVHVIGQIGNAMNVHVAAVFSIWMDIGVRRQDIPQIGRMLKLRRSLSNSNEDVTLASGEGAAVNHFSE